MYQPVVTSAPPLIIAHRGASFDAPENTLAAFELACRQGADMLELDVQRCADGVLVVFHDATTHRWDGVGWPVRQCSLAYLRSLDINGERVPTLAEVCALARTYPVALNVELKQPDIAAQVVALLRATGLTHRSLLSSFDPAALRSLQATAPGLRCAYLMGTRSYHPGIRARELWPLLHLRAVGAHGWHPAAQLHLLRFLLPVVRRAGYAVNVWTIDDPARMRQIAAWGASGIITNRPALAREVLHYERRTHTEKA